MEDEWRMNGGSERSRREYCQVAMRKDLAGDAGESRL
jgi:hypothetical protein